MLEQKTELNIKKVILDALEAKPNTYSGSKDLSEDNWQSLSEDTKRYFISAEDSLNRDPELFGQSEAFTSTIVTQTGYLTYAHIIDKEKTSKIISDIPIESVVSKLTPDFHNLNPQDDLSDVNFRKLLNQLALRADLKLLLPDVQKVNTALQAPDTMQQRTLHYFEAIAEQFDNIKMYTFFQDFYKFRILFSEYNSTITFSREQLEGIRLNDATMQQMDTALLKLVLPSCYSNLKIDKEYFAELDSQITNLKSVNFASGARGHTTLLRFVTAKHILKNNLIITKNGIEYAEDLQLNKQHIPTIPERRTF